MNNKKAYPNDEGYQEIDPSRDLTKWMEILKQIYFQERNGISKSAAEEFLIKNWDEAERADFKSWRKFYEEGSHLKYKKAQNFFQGTAPGYFIPLEPKKEELAPKPAKDIDYAKSLISSEMPLAEKKMIIERQRAKILGRLDSAGKLLRSNEGDLFAGNELESLIEALHNLKKKVLTMNKLSLSTKIYDDMIVREANVLVKSGFSKAGDILFSLSQNAPAPGVGLPVAELPSVPTIEVEKPNTAIIEFLKNMETSNIAVHDVDEEKIEKDRAKKEDQAQADDLEVHDDELEVNDFVVQAQAAPLADPEPVTVPAPSPEGVDVVSPTNTEAAPLNKFDDKLNEVFSDISVADVVAKLEEVANVFRTREVPRQLGVIDMMLDSLGLASLFNSLPEAVNKSLEANNYCLTRIEDIISKLRGSLKTTPMNLTDAGSSNNPEAAQVKDKLQNDLNKDKERKDKRKEQENLKDDIGAPIAGKEVPQIDLETPPTTNTTV